MSLRPVKRISTAQPTLEGAGVALRRAFGFGQTSDYDPFLLLDDLFDKLDAGRVRQIAALVDGLHGQVFITDTAEERLRAAFAGLHRPLRYFEVQHGRVMPLKG